MHWNLNLNFKKNFGKPKGSKVLSKRMITSEWNMRIFSCRMKTTANGVSVFFLFSVWACFIDEPWFYAIRRFWLNWHVLRLNGRTLFCFGRSISGTFSFFTCALYDYFYKFDNKHFLGMICSNFAFFTALL